MEDLERRVLLSRAIGVDVSEWQGSRISATINWTSVKNAGMNFAYIRATYGTTANDLDIDTNAPNAAAAGMTIGFYHYAYYDLNGHTPALEASNFWGEVAQYYKANGKYLMPVLDVEEGSALGANTGQSSLTNWVKAWCTDVQNDAAADGLYVVPMVYCSSSPAGSDFNNTIPQKIPLWVANYTGTTTPQTSEPTAGTGQWQTWQFWQYTSSGSVSGISGNVDRDVLNGDTNVLKDYIVTSKTAQPSGRFPLNSAVQTNTGVNVYNTLADAQQQTNNFTTEPAGATGTVTSGPAYGGSFQRWLTTFQDGKSGYVAEDFLDQIASAPPAATLQTPADNAHLTLKPTSLTWTGNAQATSYDVYLDNVFKANVTASPYSLSGTTIADGTHTWQVRAKNAAGTTTGSTFTFILDTTPPTATLPVQSPGAGAATFDFNVNYADATSGVDASTIGAGDVNVIGPNNFFQAASFVGYNSTTGVATYRITAPGGVWNADDNGTYTVSQAVGQVRDTFGNSRPNGAFGTFVANTIAYLSGTTLVVDYGSSASSTMSLAPSGANLVVTKTAGGTGTASFPAASVTSILVSGGAGGDTFTYNGTIPQGLSMSLAGANNVLTVASGTLALTSDASTNSPNLTVNVSSGATLNLSSVQHLAALSIADGSVNLSAGGANTLVLSSLSITGAGHLDLNDNSLILKYVAGQSPIAAVTTFIHNGFNGGAWNGAGGITSTAAANDPNGLTALGYADNADLGDTTFAGQSGLTGNEVLVKYTYYGDADLSGDVTLDDFSQFLNGYQGQSPATNNWLNGDFDYDGQVTLDDFSQFLYGNQNQGAPLN